jgi:drug/metabolite transporter (DMT)-like permease
MPDTDIVATARPAARYDTLAIAAALTSVVLWASAFVGIRAAAVDFGPGSLALGRLVVGSLALGVLVARRGVVRPSRRDLLAIIGAGLLWFALYNVALNAAEQNIDAGTTSMLVNVAPIFLAVLAAIFLGEGFPPRLVAGLAIAFVGGAAIAVATTGDPASGGNAALGIVLCLVSALAYAAAQILQKPVLRTVSAAQVTWMACTVGMVACLPFLPALVEDIGTAQPVSIAWVLYLGLFPTAVGFTTWTFALGRTTAGHLGSMTYLIPPVVIVMAWIVLGEIPPWLAVAGGVLCIFGVIVARSRGSLAFWRRVPQPGST